MRKDVVKIFVAFFIIVGVTGQAVFAQSGEAVSSEKITESAVDSSQAVDVASDCGLVMDVGTQEVLYEKNGEKLYYPASITKLLTALVVMDHCQMDDMVIFSHDAIYDVEDGSGNNQEFEAGDKLTVEDCLYAMILESSNPAANALAEHVAGSVEEFVVEMNQKADELGCEKSNFENPSGLNDEKQQTTAYDMALVSCEVFQNETLREICSTKTHQLSPTLNQKEGYLLHMEHKMVNGEEEPNGAWVLVGGKTGYTSKAGNTLVTYAQEDGKELVSVVMKSEQTHYEDTRNLLNYGFDNYESVVVNTQKEEAKAAVTASNPMATMTPAAVQKSEIDTGGNFLKSLNVKGIVWKSALVVFVVGVFLFVAVCYLRARSRERRRRERMMLRKKKRIQELERRRKQDYLVR